MSVEYVHFESESDKKPINWKLYILIFFIIILMIIGLIVSTDYRKSNISENQLALGKNIDIKEGDKINFIFYNEKYTLTVNSVLSDSVTITIQNMPIMNLMIDEEKYLDINQDSINDIQIKLLMIDNRIPYFLIKKSVPGTGEDNQSSVVIIANNISGN